MDQIREAIREELDGIATSLTEKAMRAGAISVVEAERAARHGVLSAVATLLAVRLLLLLALLGGFALAFMALQHGTYEAGGVLVAYAVLIVIPLIYLERNPRVKS